jgi:hypothetical protein
MGVMVFLEWMLHNYKDKNASAAYMRTGGYGVGSIANWRGVASTQNAVRLSMMWVFLLSTLFNFWDKGDSPKPG